MGSDMLTEDRLARVRALNDVAARRGQSLAQLALAWALRDPRMTSLVIGASSVAQLEDNVAALDNLDSPRTSWPRSTGTPPRPTSTLVPLQLGLSRPRATGDRSSPSGSSSDGNANSVSPRSAFLRCPARRRAARGRGGHPT